MSAPDPRMRWWGWGIDRDAMRLPPSAQAMIEAGLGVKEAPPKRVELDAIQLPASRLDTGVGSPIQSIVGAGGGGGDHPSRVGPPVRRRHSGPGGGRPGPMSPPGL